MTSWVHFLQIVIYFVGIYCKSYFVSLITKTLLINININIRSCSNFLETPYFLLALFTASFNKISHVFARCFEYFKYFLIRFDYTCMLCVLWLHSANSKSPFLHSVKRCFLVYKTCALLCLCRFYSNWSLPVQILDLVFCWHCLVLNSFDSSLQNKVTWAISFYNVDSVLLLLNVIFISQNLFINLHNNVHFLAFFIIFSLVFFGILGLECLLNFVKWFVSLLTRFSFYLCFLVSNSDQ